MKFSELVNIDDLKKLCEDFTSLTGMVTAILDLDGNILIATGWQDICTCFHRVHPITAERCRESDTFLAGKLIEGEQANVYRCKNGLVDVAVPIKLNGRHVANLFTGQFFLEPPDRNIFIRQAEEFGFNKEAYLKALDRVPIYSQDRVNSSMSFLSQIGRLLGEMGLARKEIEDANVEIQQESNRHAESEQQFRTLLNTIPDLIWLKDSEGVYLSCNREFERFFGAKEANIVGKTDYDFVDKELADHFRKYDRKAMSAGNPSSNEEWLTFAEDGHQALMYTTKTPMHSKDGTLIGILGIGRDITALHQAQQNTIREKETAQQYLDIAGVMFAALNKQGEIILMNKMGYQTLGYPEGELLGRNWFEVCLPAAIQAEIKEVFRQQMIGDFKPLQYYENAIVDSAGEERMISFHNTLLQDETGIYGVLFSGEDITDRKQAEKALQNAAHEWRLIMDEFEDVICLLDNDRRILRANAAFYKALETTPAQAIGRHIVELIHPQCEKDPCSVCLAQEEKRDVVLTMEADDANNPIGRPTEIRVKIVRDEAGASTGILMNLHDLTQARLAEQTLRESEQKFRLLADYNYDWEYWLNPEGDYIYVSPSCERITGYSADDFIANPRLLFDLISPDYAETVRQHYADENIKKTPLYSMEFSIRTKAGEERWLEHHCSPVFDEQGNYAGRRGNNRDITVRKKTEQERLDLENQLRQKYKMDSLGVMAGGMAHNFNNNLSIILGNVELSKMKMPPNPEIDGYLSNAKIAVLRARDLIQQILTYSRQGIKDKTSIQLPLIIDETLQLLRSTMPTTMNLQQKISSGSHDLTINADSSQIQECLINLCNNAVHAMEEEGDLTIALDSVELQKYDIPTQYESRAGHYAKLSVQDNGSGMSAETVDKIFDLFFTTKPVDKGTGVGLSTVQGIVTQHGGLIKVHSHVGEGTTFELYFPVIDQTQTHETISVNEDLPKGTELILYVDDDEMLASLGEKLLTEMGYQVCVMTESPEALKMFTANAEHFDLVITDQTMPQLSGKDLIKELKKVKPDIPTILCTGFSSKIDDKNSAELGINAFLMKPLELVQLAQTVRRVLDGVEIE
ncbi:MAG: PAS domain S-box protein [Desulfuromusa sp.]|jgi:two-component system cell cycle sensor histidine kinase/response regulator CckA|nr:PAS domain S-box protein [Desulfuromusa sp.]